jgi:hypothetical protein
MKNWKFWENLTRHWVTKEQSPKHHQPNGTRVCAACGWPIRQHDHYVIVEARHVDCDNPQGKLARRPRCGLDDL